MTDPNVEPSEQELEDAFNEAGEPDAPVADKPSAEVAPTVEAQPEVEVTAKPEMLTVPAEEYNQLVSTVLKLNEQYGEHGKKFNQAFGKIGSVEDFVSKLQREASSGEPVVVLDEDMAELSDEFPSIAKGMQTTLNKVLSKAKGFGSKSVDSEQLNELLRPLLEKERQENLNAIAVDRERIKQEMYKEQVLDVHPDMDALIKTDDWKNYYAKLPVEKQTAWKPKIIIETLNAYKASKAPKQPQRNERAEALAAAVNPRGSGPAMKGKVEQSLDDAFEEGFKGRR